MTRAAALTAAGYNPPACNAVLGSSNPGATATAAPYRLVRSRGVWGCPSPPHMVKFCIFTGMLVLSTGFGMGADALGCSFFWSFMISGVGGMAGCVAGWWVHRRFLS